MEGGTGLLVSSAELYDQGLGFDPNWQPLLTTVSSFILPGSELTASGSRFQGISEASGGNGAQNSSSNYPLVQLLSLANEQTLFLPVDAMTGWSDTSFTSAPITLMTTSSSGFPIGYALVTVFTNGIPSQSQFVLAPTFTSTPTPYADSKCNADTNSHVYSDSDANGYSDIYGNGNCDIYAYAYCYSDGNCNSNSNSNSNADAYTYGDTKADANTEIIAYTEASSHAGASPVGAYGVQILASLLNEAFHEEETK